MTGRTQLIAQLIILALPKWKGRQSGRKKEAAEVCCLSLLFWVKICDAQQQTATATPTANIASNQNLNTELTKNKPKKSGTSLFILIIFRFFFSFLGFFVLAIARFCKQGQSQSEPVGFSLGKQQKTFHAETWQSTANLTWTLPNRFHHGQKQQDQKTQSCLRICCCEWRPKRSTSAAPVSWAWPCHISCHAWPAPLAYDS